MSFRTPPPHGGVVLQKPIEPSQEQKTLDDQIAEARLKQQLKEGLPFLYGWPWYKWAREFYESQNKMNFLCAGNQLSKSSTQIRKCINWATDQSLWPTLWARKPTQFWYLYPSGKQVSAEFETKWKQFLPTGKYKKDRYYGYAVERSGATITAIHFASGVHVYFKTYMQNSQALQSGSCDAIFCDEELPEDLLGELKFRTAATDGYFHMVFTATLGQEIWRKTMEPEEGEEEVFPDAFKQTISLYDSMVYEDGKPSPWTIDRIKRMEAQCPTHNEVLKRVFGKFIFSGGGRIYESFDIKRHKKTKHPLNKDWQIYCGVDIGSGGVNHPPAICFVAVKPDQRAGRVFLGWLGDDGANYTAGDVVKKTQDMIRDHKLTVTKILYDWGSKDFFEIATRNGLPVEKAEKDHKKGEDTLNTLFKNDMLFIYEDEELLKLASELASLKGSVAKRNAKDDFVDALRYAVTKIPWDWTCITGAAPEDQETPEKPMNDMQRQIAERRKAFDDSTEQEQQRINDEFSEWNEAYGSGEF